MGAIVVNTHTTPITYTVDSKLQSVDANQLLSAISPVKQTLYGALSANADTHFTTAAGARSILPTLDGKVSLNLKDGKIANVDLLHQLASIAQFQRSASAVEPFTHLVQLTGDFDIHNGVARTNNLKAAIDAGSVAVTGLIDLAHERLDLRLTAVLAQNYSQSVGGTNIGGFLNTALANNNGELVIPVVVTGTFQQPQFAPDLQAVASMKLKNLVPGVNNPAGLENALFGQILRGKPGLAPVQQQNPVNDLLNLFNKGKK
jgi:AsmA protein